jgi:hypothetical protein
MSQRGVKRTINNSLKRIAAKKARQIVLPEDNSNRERHGLERIIPHGDNVKVLSDEELAPLFNAVTRLLFAKEEDRRQDNDNIRLSISHIAVHHIFGTDPDKYAQECADAVMRIPFDEIERIAVKPFSMTMNGWKNDVMVAVTMVFIVWKDDPRYTKSTRR